MDWFITITLSYTNIIHYSVFDLIHSANLERFHYRDWYKHYTNSSCTFKCSFIHFFKAKRKHKCRKSLISYLFPLFGKRKKNYAENESCWKSMHARAHSNSLQPFGLQPTRLLCPWDPPSKNTGTSCHCLLQGIFLTQGWTQCLLCLLHWQVDSFTTELPGKSQ